MLKGNKSKFTNGGLGIYFPFCQENKQILPKTYQRTYNFFNFTQ